MVQRCNKGRNRRRQSHPTRCSCGQQCWVFAIKSPNHIQAILEAQSQRYEITQSNFKKNMCLEVQCGGGCYQFQCPQKLPRIQASDWLAPMEAIINNNNSLVAPIRGLDFWELLGTKKLSPYTTPNLQTHSARTGKFVVVSLPISYL